MALRTVTVDVSELREPVPVRRVSQREVIMRHTSSAGVEHKALRDELLASNSALNARRPQVDPALSKTSMLNVRYTSHMASSTVNGSDSGYEGGGHDNRQGQGYASRSRFINGNRQTRNGSFRSEVSEGSSNMDQWVDGLFDSALDRNVDELGNSHAIGRRIRGIGDGMYPSQVCCCYKHSLMQALATS